MTTQTNASCPHGEPRPRVNIRKTPHNRHMAATGSPQERPRAHSEQSIYIPVSMRHLIPGGDWQRQQVLQRDPTQQAPCLWLDRLLCTFGSSPHCWRHCLPFCGYLWVSAQQISAAPCLEWDSATGGMLQRPVGSLAGLLHCGPPRTGFLQ